MRSTVNHCAFGSIMVCMNQILLLDVLPPTTNHSHVHTRSGFTFLSQKTKDFREEVFYKARLQGVKRFEGWLSYRVDISFGKFKNGKFKSGDASNRIKQLEDSLNGIAWIDDEQVIETHIYRHFDELPYCKLSISTIENDTDRRLREEYPDAPGSSKAIRGSGIRNAR